MEPPYGFFHTASGCLAGVACAAVHAAVGFAVLFWLPSPVWLRAVALVAAGVPVMAPAFVVDRRSRGDRA